VPRAALILVLANTIYGTSYVVARAALDTVPPATLALARFALGGLVLLPFALREPGAASPWGSDRWLVFWMGVIGHAAAYALLYSGLALSTATSGALLIVVEPVSLIGLGAWLLRERPGRFEALGAVVALTGAVLVVVNGIPGLSRSLLPRWRGDLLMIAAGVAFAVYSVLGRPLLARHATLPVTVWSIAWAVAALLPLAALEWLEGLRPTWTAAAVLGTVYLALVVTAIGYVLWNQALARLATPRVAVFLTIQPVVGALLGVVLLGEPLTPFTAAGGALIVAGLVLTARGAPG
jgi:drug/metabolite transporter (DMT)-like permease